jgi:hypothetical protein
MKTNNINKRILYCLAMVLVISAGCKKDFLEPKPLSFYSPDNSMVDIPGFNAALAACAKNLRDEYYGDGAPIISENIFSEVAVEGTTDKTGPAQNMDILIKPDAQLNHVDYNRIGWYWTQEYIGIRLANTVISRVGGVKTIPDSAKNIILGKAYFFRSFDYYRLVNQFGDVPCPMKELTGPKVDFATVKREVILARMKQDLEFAVKYVPWITDKGDVNRGAVYHLLTKVNLALGLFDDAIASANAVINSGYFRLMTSRFGVDAGVATKNVTWDLHRPENKSLPTNTEGLFLVTDRFGDVGAYSGGMSIMRQAVPWYGGGQIITPDQKNGVATTQGVEIDNFSYYGRGIGRCRLTPYSTVYIWDDVNDLRHDSTSGNWMYMENLRYNDPALKKANNPYYGQRLRLYNGNSLLVKNGDTIRYWYPWPHYKLFVADQENNPMRGGHSDWYIFRLAETYLLRAEAYLWKGDAASATADINTIRTRAKCAPYTSAQVNLGTVLDERARELYWEEPRKTELTRMAYIFAKTGTPYNGKTYTSASFSTANFFYDRVLEKNDFYRKNIATVHSDIYKMSPYHILWPIPQDAINANTNGRINQNQGYTGFELNVPPLDKIPE